VVLAAALLLAGFLVDARISRAQLRTASDELQLLMTLRKGALESYFDTVRAELTFWSINDGLRRQLRALRDGWAQLPGDPHGLLQRGYIDENPHPPEQRRELVAFEDGSAYADAHRGIHALARAFVVERGYYDFFLIDPAGHVIYSVEKESDFADSLAREPLGASGLARAYRRALEAHAEPRVVFSDFSRYAPSHDEPALFAAVPVLGVGGDLIGVMAVQVPTERIQEIMQFTAGMGRTGETYLVGGDLLMRSDSRFSDESTTLEVRIESDTAKRALAGESGVALVDDYRGVPVLSAYGAFELDDFEWAVMAEVDREEVFESVSRARLSLPVLGGVFYVLSMLTLWLIDPRGTQLDDLVGIDPGEPPPG
jgi:methyl-accepting chemotaxis protein